MFTGVQHFQNLGNSWYALGATKRHELLELVVITLGIDHTDLIFLFDEPLNDGRHRCRFAAARRPGYEEPRTVGFQAKLLALFRMSQQNLVTAQTRRKALQILRQQLIDALL